MAIVSEGGDKAFLNIKWSHDQWVMWPGGWDIVRATELDNKNIYVLQIGAALFYYKLGQTLLQIGKASLLQIRTSVVTNWGSYYK